jgi:hypothetical protein
MSAALKPAETHAALLAVERVPEFWPHLAPHAAAALARSAGEYALEDVEAYCLSGAWRVWVATRPGELVAMAMVQVQTYPRARILFVHLAGAEEGEGLSVMWPQVQRWARDCGCAAMRFVGRPGWLRSGFIPRSAGARIEQASIVVPVEG